MREQPQKELTIAIFGASGYIGLILTDHLLRQDHDLRLFVRDKRRLTYLKGIKKTRLSDTPLLEHNLEAIASELEGVDVVYYLIHSMEKSVKDFSATDHLIASIVGDAAAKADVKQIIYIGGLGKMDSEHALSKHLQSRQTTAIYLKRSGIPLTEFRTGIVIGEGSASFEMIRTLSTKLPFIPVIEFNKGVCQIIDIHDLILYLDQALDNPLYLDKIIEIGTERAYDYNELVTIYAHIVKHRDLRLIDLPLLRGLFNESTISLLISAFTRIPVSLAKPLIEGMKSLAVIDKYPIESIDPQNMIVCRSFEESIIHASSYRDEVAFESLWELPVDVQAYLFKSDGQRPFFSQKLRNGLFFSSLVDEVDHQDAEKTFMKAKRLIRTNRFQKKSPALLLFDMINTLFRREKLEANSSFLVLTESSISKDWRVAALLRSPEHSFVTLTSQLKGNGFLWFQVSVQTDKDQRTYLMLRLFFEPISVYGHLYWKSVKKLHHTLLQEIHEAIFDDTL